MGDGGGSFRGAWEWEAWEESYIAPITSNPRPHPVLNSMCMGLLSDVVSQWNVYVKQAHFGEFSSELVCF